MDGYLTWVAAGLEQRFVLAASVEIGKEQHCRLLLTALMQHNGWWYGNVILRI